MNAAVIAAAALAARQQAALATLKRLRATSEATAARIPDDGESDLKIYDSLLKAGLAEKTGEGRYWLTAKGQRRAEGSKVSGGKVVMILIAILMIGISVIGIVMATG